MKYTAYVDTLKKTGSEIVADDDILFWTTTYGGNKKPRGPLAGKTIGLLVASEFSDWQAYYLSEFIGEFGGVAQFIMNVNHLWKETRPMRESDIPHGMWGLSLTQGMDGLGLNATTKLEPPVRVPEADPEAYDALIVLGDHSGDIIVADPEPMAFIEKVADKEIPIAAIGGGILPLIHLGIMNNRKCTGNRAVDYLLKKVGDYRADSVITDGHIITGRHTADTPAVLRALCRVFDTSFEDIHKDLLKGKKVMAMIAEDWEDVEMCPIIMEFIYRGAEIIVGLFEPEKKSRPALLGLDVRHGSYGTTVPFQEIPESYYRMVKQDELKMSDYDALFIPGAFNPWHLTVLHREYLREAYAAGKLLASICHGPIPVAAADIISGRRMCGWDAVIPSIKTMGGTFEEGWAAGIDGQIITGKTPPEVPDFLEAISVALLK